MPADSRKTPYCCETAPCGQKSDSSGNVYPWASAHARSVYLGSHDTASTWTSSFWNPAMSSRISHSSPVQIPEKANG